MVRSRLCLCGAFILASATDVGSQLALPEYVSFSASDSAHVAASTVERFLWKNSFECPYTVIRAAETEVKGFVVFLHGAGDNPTNFSKIAGRCGLHKVEFVVPRAPFVTTVHLPNPKSGVTEAFTGYSWVDSQDRAWPDRGASFSAFLVGRVVEQMKPAGAEGPPVVLIGFRQGAGMALLAAGSDPGRVRALVLVSGYADPPVQESLGAPWITLSDIPCLVLIGTDSPDALESGHLAVTAKRLGARVESHYLPRGSEFVEEDYALIRSFVGRCCTDSASAGHVSR